MSYHGSKAAVVNLWIQQGADFRLTIQLKNPDGTNFDLTGYSNPQAQVRKSFNSADYYAFDVTIDGNPSSGKIHLFMDDSVTSALPFQKGVWDLEAINPSGDVERLVRGEVMVIPEVTK